MTAAKEKLSRAIDIAIPILILLQVSTVSISIAVSSIMFTVWMSLWLLQMVIDSRNALSVFRSADLKAINIFVVLYFTAEVVSRVFAVIPDHAFDNIKRLLLFGIFYASVAKITGTLMLSRMLVFVLSLLSAISAIELITYAVKFGEMIQTTPFSEIRIDYFNYPLTSAEIKLMVLMAFMPVVLGKADFIIRRPLLILLSVPVVASMLLTQSRNVYLALFICLIVYGIFESRKVLAFTAALTVISFLVLPASVTQRVSSIFDTEHPSNRSRILMWQTGWKMFLDHPITGIADSDFLGVYKTYKTPEYHGEGVHMHNNFMMILATTGIAGMLAFLGLFAAIISGQWRMFRRSRDALSRALIAGSLYVMLSFLITGMFEWNFGDHEVMTVFFFLISVPFVVSKTTDKDDTIELHSS
ncbi:MAG: O-antigen ligase family protein [Ignavibacteria bacterium]|nr:O-antigen ligase family protein [Ignavibacteria bacterium]